MLKVLFTVASLCLAATPAHAYLIAYDDFDSDAAATTLNISPLTNWSVSNGTVDYIRNDELDDNLGILCLGGMGGCIDTDGSTMDAGRITLTTPIVLTAGAEYRLTFHYSGNQRNGSTDSLVFGYGTTELDMVSAAGDAGFVTHQTVFIANASGLTSLYFEGLGGDNIGLILDGINLQQFSSDPDVVVPAGVPEPASLALLGLGLVALSVVGRRRA